MFNQTSNLPRVYRKETEFIITTNELSDRNIHTAYRLLQEGRAFKGFIVTGIEHKPENISVHLIKK